MRIIPILLVFVFSVNSSAGILQYCYYALKRNFHQVHDQPVKRLENMTKMQKISNKLRKKTSVPVENAQTQLVDKRIATVSNQIQTQNYETLYRDLRVLWGDVELNFKNMLQQEELIAQKMQLAKNAKNAERVVLFKEINQAKKSFNKSAKVVGQQFVEYKGIRHYLESQLKYQKCSFECQSEIRKVLGKMGAGDKVPLASMEKQLIETPLSGEVMMFQETTAEFRRVVRDHLNAFAVQKKLVPLLADSHLATLPVIKDVFKNFWWNKIARTKHFHLIDDVIRFEGNIQNKVKMLEDVMAKTSDTSLLVTFARREDYAAKKAFQEIYDYANVRREYSVLRKLMNESQDLSQKIGPINLIEKKSKAALLVTSIVVVGGVSTVLYFNFSSPETREDNGPVAPNIPPNGPQDDDNEVIPIDIRIDNQEIDELLDQYEQILDILTENV